MVTAHESAEPIEDLIARLAAADAGWTYQRGDPPADPDYIRRLATHALDHAAPGPIDPLTQACRRPHPTDRSA